jgi:predicted secreted protein|tara:strand:- start:1709 stop:2146 length:438 start_codon:yes stop_codon:yes gene_type:complete
MAILNGTELKVYSGNSGQTNLIAFAQNCTLNVNHSPREITNKDSNGFKEILEGLRDYSLDVDGAYAWTNGGGTAVTDGADDLIDANILTTRQPVTFMFGDNQSTDDNYYTGQGYITSMSLTGGTEDTATYSFSIEGTGPLSRTEV